jgi:hypothetical protein
MQKVLFVSALALVVVMLALAGAGFDYPATLAAVMLPSANVKPLVHTVNDIMALLSCSRSFVCELIGKGKLDAVKVLTATRITDESVQRLLSSAPKGLSDPAVPERKTKPVRRAARRRVSAEKE